MKDLILNLRFWAAASATVLSCIVILAALVHYVEPKLQADPALYRRVGIAMSIVFFLLTCSLAFSFAPVLVGGFLRVQVRLGNQGHFLVAFMQRHQAEVVLALWGIWAAGLLIASPYVVRHVFLGKD